MRVLCVIPARAGSKRLPGKNLADFGGKPLIAYSVECAAAVLRTQLKGGRTIVSTDSEQLAADAREAGADVPWLRPSELATDEATTHDVLRHALMRCESDGDKPYDAVLLLQPTSPLRMSEDVTAGLQLFQEKQAELVVSLSTITRNPNWRYILASDGALHKPESGAQGTLCELNGAVYVYARDIVLRPWAGYPPKTFGFLMPPERSVDIDTAEDLERARQLLAQRRKAK